MTRVFAMTLTILRKDLLVEWRARAQAVALLGFAAVVLLLFSFAVGPDSTMLAKHAGGYLWLALLLASTLLLGRSLQTEVETDALEALLLAPVPPAALFYGKALANAGLLVMVALVAVPVDLAITGAGIVENPVLLALIVVLGAAGIAAPGTFYAALTARIDGRQLLLPLLLFPLVVPALLASVKATSLVMTGDPMEQLPGWIALLVCFDAIYWSLCGLLFEKVVDG
ncbi:MAG: heme exporter protein CcmB [Alphaproteobacteria bacterium]|nr:heme exporter protein CcmB [Alphaproteobacteria bacterium]